MTLRSSLLPPITEVLPRQFEEIIQERDHFKQAFEKERERQALIEKIKRSSENIDEGNVYTEEAFDKMMEFAF